MKTCKNYERAGKGSNNRTAGFEENLESLLREHEGEARQFAYRLAGNSDEAEDLVQEASYRVLRAWKSYDPVKSFQGWYLTIVKNLFRDARRSVRRQRVISLDAPKKGEWDKSIGEAFTDGEAGIPEQIEKRETARAVRRTLNTLRENQLAVVTLCDMEGVSYEAAARRLGLSIGTLRSRLCRARAALRRELELAQII
jgi:RNA polymerase sigma-70 factor (ECF subfamily)